MNRDELRLRTKQFALRIIRLVDALPDGTIGWVLGKQILKSGTSIGANYREALRASSRRHFQTTIEIVLREADETLYWLELLAEADIIAASRLGDLTQECDELVAIFAATAKSTRDNDPPRDEGNPKSHIPNPK
jgi:four helix bundle protein